mmetsp:Transcript_35414/g.97763  ORF Transcript_35414/g.97763 Transcript_35414/m.97763 type:complete len:257 (+) Transcript_35414:1072-1842(+)
MGGGGPRPVLGRSAWEAWRPRSFSGRLPLGSATLWRRRRYGVGHARCLLYYGEGCGEALAAGDRILCRRRSRWCWQRPFRRRIHASGLLWMLHRLAARLGGSLEGERLAGHGLFTLATCSIWWSRWRSPGDARRGRPKRRRRRRLAKLRPSHGTASSGWHKPHVVRALRLRERLDAHVACCGAVILPPWTCGRPRRGPVGLVRALGCFATRLRLLSLRLGWTILICGKVHLALFAIHAYSAATSPRYEPVELQYPP